jgi:hypothetical protein
MNTEEMRQAMNTLRQFSEKEKNYFAYQARQNFIRQQNSIYAERDAIAVERDAIALREQQTAAERDAALAEIEKLSSTVS